MQDIREGDIAGIMAFQGTYGVMGVRAIDAFQKEIVLIKRENGNECIEEKVGLQENRLWLRIDFDFTNNNDKAFFYYATEEQKWISLGQPLQMKYTLDLFIGYRIGILYSATQKSGGNVYYRDFRYIK